MFNLTERADVKKGIVFFALIAAIVMVLFLVIRMVFVLPNAAISIVEKTLDPNNIVLKYEWFFNTAASINARTAQIKAHKELVSAETAPAEKTRLRIEQAGQQQSCREMVQSYNANASKVNVSLFKTAATPISFSPSICE